MFLGAVEKLLKSENFVAFAMGAFLWSLLPHSGVGFVSLLLGLIVFVHYAVKLDQIYAAICDSGSRSKSEDAQLSAKHGRTAAEEPHRPENTAFIPTTPLQERAE